MSLITRAYLVRYSGAASGLSTMNLDSVTASTSSYTVPYPSLQCTVSKGIAVGRPLTKAALAFSRSLSMRSIPMAGSKIFTTVSSSMR